MIQKIQQNIFIGYIKSICKKEDFKFLTDAFVKLLNNPLQANRTYLPHSTKSIECHHEILMLFWKFLQYNKVRLHSLFHFKKLKHFKTKLGLFRIFMLSTRCS